MKNLFLSFQTAVLIFLLSFCSYAQVHKEERITLISSKPAVYVDFDRVGEGEQLYETDSKERVWLKLVNNTKWSIYVAAFGIKDSKEIGLFHEVESTRKMLSDEDFPDVPVGYKIGDARSPDIEIKSNKSIEFSIPRNHLAKNLRIKINFSFDWEHLEELAGYRFSVPSHSIYFSELDSKNSIQIDNEASFSSRNIVRAPHPSSILIGKAIKLPKPQLISCHCTFGNVKGVTTVVIQTEIDESGNVSKATAISGHSVLKLSSEQAAKKSRFSPSIVSSNTVKAKALIIYRFTIVDKWSVKFKDVNVKIFKSKICRQTNANVFANN